MWSRRPPLPPPPLHRTSTLIHRTMLFIISLVTVFLTICDASPTQQILPPEPSMALNPPPPSQRRFMWRQMDDTMDGLMGSVVDSARAMGSMFGDLLPSALSSQHHTAATGGSSGGHHHHHNQHHHQATQHGHLGTTPSILDFMPTEMTRIKYIIRNPHTHKPMKIIKVRPQKKLVKLLPGTPPQPVKQPPPSPASPSSPNRQLMRQLEREKEAIAEGRVPPSRPPSLPGKEETQNEQGHQSDDDNEVYKAQIFESLGEGWRPVLPEALKQTAPPAPSTSKAPPLSTPAPTKRLAVPVGKALPLTRLHTHFISSSPVRQQQYQHQHQQHQQHHHHQDPKRGPEADPEPIEHRHENEEDLQHERESVPRKTHMYAVTEYETEAEETETRPVSTHPRHHQQHGSIAAVLRTTHGPAESRRSTSSTVMPPTLSHAFAAVATSLNSVSSNPIHKGASKEDDSEEDEPNYPAAFLKKYRERFNSSPPAFLKPAPASSNAPASSTSTASSKMGAGKQNTFRPSAVATGNTWVPSLTATKHKLKTSAVTVMRSLSPKWPLSESSPNPTPYRPSSAVTATVAATSSDDSDTVTLETRTTERRKKLRPKETSGSLPTASHLYAVQPMPTTTGRQLVVASRSTPTSTTTTTTTSKPMPTAARPKDIRQRGSIKFGDKLTYE